MHQHKLLISQNQFIESIEKIQMNVESINKLSKKICEDCNLSFKNDLLINNDILIVQSINLLKLLTFDNNNLIEKFVFDYDFGKTISKGSIDKKHFKSTKALYNHLLKSTQKQNNNKKVKRFINLIIR